MGKAIVQFRPKRKKTSPPKFYMDLWKIQVIAMAGASLRDLVPVQQTPTEVLRLLVQEGLVCQAASRHPARGVHRAYRPVS